MMCREATLASPTATLPPPPSQANKKPSSVNLSDPLPLAQSDSGSLLGPDGELWLPKDPFHAYEGPLVFGPHTAWNPVQQDQTQPPATNDSPPPTLSPDAEHTRLPSGLLDSPSCQDDGVDAVGIDAVCTAILSVPVAAVLPPPAVAGRQDAVPEAEGPGTESIMRRSKRLVAQPTTNQKPAETPS
jgi:hypothetical protein